MATKQENMKILLLILLLTISTFAQDYGPKATDKEAAVRMHFAIKLFRGVDKAQEDFLLKAIANRRSVSEEETARIFSKAELRDVFFGIGRADISTFKQMYEKERIADKKEIWNGLSKDEQTDARRINFAWGVGYLKLNEVQVDYLLRFSKALPTITRDEADLFQTEAVGLFTIETGRLLFGSIGPFIDKCGTVNLQQQGNCRCSAGSSFNMSCDSCPMATGQCTATAEGCGFAWLYGCNGVCTSS
jgi:hypothetical protein